VRAGAQDGGFMAFLVALVVWLVALGLAIPFFTKWWWLPDAITEHARAVDSQFNLTLIGTGIIFILAQAALGYAVLRFGRKRKEPADYVHGNDRWEVLWTTATTVIFVGLTLMGYSVWAEARFLEPPNASTPNPDRLVVEVTGQQFVWNMRYAGKDGKFGPLDIKQINDSLGNPLGVDRNSADGKDDVMVPRMAVPVNREVEVLLRTKDVIHNFFVPELRIKLDTVPGLIGKLHFKPEKVGTYEIACSELCGLGHYKMRSFMDVMEPADFEKWLQEQYSYLPQ
jgi:cytochrome c oxidase subunit 2